MIQVAVGIVERDGRVLVCQRKKGAQYELKWEFPGGKMESGEDPKTSVVQKYGEFLERSPTLVSLAQARTSSVIRAWSGFGYNARALRLQKLARLVIREYGGRIPDDPDLLHTARYWKVHSECGCKLCFPEGYSRCRYQHP
jgi:8-oxo-dGTP pyrophosphatase MutT (NUDIX family)